MGLPQMEELFTPQVLTLLLRIPNLVNCMQALTDVPWDLIMEELLAYQTSKFEIAEPKIQELFSLQESKACN